MGLLFTELVFVTLRIQISLNTLKIILTVYKFGGFLVRTIDLPVSESLWCSRDQNFQLFFTASRARYILN